MKGNKITGSRAVLWGVFALCCLLCLLAAVSALRGRFSFTVSQYTVPSQKLNGGFRVVHLSDLHNREYGDGNVRLLNAVQEQQPDLILFTGDLVTETLPGREPALSLLRELVKIAPVYVSLGNHELEYAQWQQVDLRSMLEETGATVLDKEYLDLEIQGQPVRLGGLYGYCLPAKYLFTGEADKEECAFLYDFQDTPRHTLLLSHMPACWIVNKGLEEWQVDSVFSGHAHGGQIRLPFIGGIYAPDQGFFPGWVEGVTASENGQKHLIISRGLGSSVPLPRVFNTPEIVVVDFVPAS
jgi:predicted MPP superfamily phosphohydrolase